MSPLHLAEPVGLVLAGGAARRMGSDKARLVRGSEPGPTLAEWAARRLAEVCAEVALADGGRGLVAGHPTLPDGPGAGPAAGLLGGAAAYPGRSLLALAVDLPEIPTALLAEIAASPGWDWAVPEPAAGRLEPLCALYGPAALAALAAAVAQGHFALHRLAEEPGLQVRRLGPDLLSRFGLPERLFINLNTPEDVRRWRAGQQNAAAVPSEPPGRT